MKQLIIICGFCLLLVACDGSLTPTLVPPTECRPVVFNPPTAVANLYLPKANLQLPLTQLQLWHNNQLVTTITVELATTETSQDQGLQGRLALAADRGMLYVFPNLSSYGFWMKDTPLNLDIAFIDRAGRINEIQNMIAYDRATVHQPTSPFYYALAVNTGYFDSHCLRVGDYSKLP